MSKLYNHIIILLRISTIASDSALSTWRSPGHSVLLAIAKVSAEARETMNVMKTFLISSLFSCLLVHLLFSCCLLIIRCAMFMMRNLVPREISDSRNENRLDYLMNRQLSKQTYKCFLPANATLQAFCKSVVISMANGSEKLYGLFPPVLIFSARKCLGTFTESIRLHFPSVRYTRWKYHS